MLNSYYYFCLMLLSVKEWEQESVSASHLGIKIMSWQSSSSSCWTRSKPTRMVHGPDTLHDDGRQSQSVSPWQRERNCITGPIFYCVNNAPFMFYDIAYYVYMLLQRCWEISIQAGTFFDRLIGLTLICYLYVCYNGIAVFQVLFHKVGHLLRGEVSLRPQIDNELTLQFVVDCRLAYIWRQRPNIDTTWPRQWWQSFYDYFNRLLGWLGGTTGSASDQRSEGCGFEAY